MIKLQNLQELTPINPIEIDFAVLDLQTKFRLTLDWLTSAYGKAYRIDDVSGEVKLVLPEVYVGNTDGKYSLTPTTPDNDKKGIVFFVIERENYPNYQANTVNLLTYNVGIVFWANLELIDLELSKNEDFTQLLIKQVRDLLTNELLGAGYRLQIQNVVRDKQEVYKEFRLDEAQRWGQMPFSLFRFNTTITLREQCGLPVDRENALLENITDSEFKNIIIPSIDFSGNNFESLTEQQKTDLRNKLIL